MPLSRPALNTTARLLKPTQSGCIQSTFLRSLQPPSSLLPPSPRLTYLVVSPLGQATASQQCPARVSTRLL